MEKLEKRIAEIFRKDNTTIQENFTDIARETKDLAVRFARWTKEQGYIYVGEGDYMYPDAQGLIGGEYVFDIFLQEKYK